MRSPLSSVTIPFIGKKLNTNGELIDLNTVQSLKFLLDTLMRGKAYQIYPVQQFVPAACNVGSLNLHQPGCWDVAMLRRDDHYRVKMLRV